MNLILKYIGETKEELDEKLMKIQYIDTYYMYNYEWSLLRDRYTF